MTKKKEEERKTVTISQKQMKQVRCGQKEMQEEVENGQKAEKGYFGNWEINEYDIERIQMGSEEHKQQGNEKNEQVYENLQQRDEEENQQQEKAVENQ